MFIGVPHLLASDRQGNECAATRLRKVLHSLTSAAQRLQRAHGSCVCGTCRFDLRFRKIALFATASPAFRRFLLNLDQTNHNAVNQESFCLNAEVTPLLGFTAKPGERRPRPTSLHRCNTITGTTIYNFDKAHVTTKQKFSEEPLSGVLVLTHCLCGGV